MAGLLDIFGTGGVETMGLLGMSPEDVQRNRDSAQAQALYALAGRLFQGGRGASSVLEGLQQGQQAYRTAMQGSLQQQLQNAQVQEMLRKRQQDQLALAEQRRIQNVLGQGVIPEVQARPSQEIMEDGRFIGDSAAIQARPAGFDIGRIAPQLMATPEGRKALSELVSTQKAMGGETFKLGEGEKQYQRNPLTGEVSEVATGGPRRRDTITVGNQVLDKNTMEVLYTAPEKQNLTTDYNNWVLAGKPNTFAQWLSESKKPLVVMTEGQKGFENTTDLKKQFGGEPIYKEFSGMQTAYSQVTSAIKEGTPIGDTAAATKIMKLLDPSSVVRETELGMAMAATGRMDRLKNYMDLYISGKKLTDSQRTEFQSLADQLYNAAATAYNSKRGEYENIGKGFKLNTDLALGPPAKVMGGATDLAAQAKAELERRRKVKDGFN
jgi:hypothetical protein